MKTVNVKYLARLFKLFEFQVKSLERSISYVNILLHYYTLLHCLRLHNAYMFKVFGLLYILVVYTKSRTTST